MGRMQAAYRILGLLYFVTIGWIVMSIAGVAAGLWMVIDVIAELLTGGEGWSPSSDSGLGGFLHRLYRWGLDQFQYVAFGKGTFPLLP